MKNWKMYVPDLLKRIYLSNLKDIDNPYIEEDHKNQCIFIHIPKNAGISISEALFNSNIGHRKIKYFKIFDPDRFKEYFKFTFVRNPWDRFVSAYYFLKQGGRNPTDKKWGEENLSEFNSFEEFALALQDRDFASHVLSEQHFSPQWKWFCGYRDEIMVDFIGRVENIRSDFNYIKDKLGIEAHLPHKNESNHPPYRELYNEKTKNIVGKLYKKDIEILDYNFKE